MRVPCSSFVQAIATLSPCAGSLPTALHDNSRVEINTTKYFKPKVIGNRRCYLWRKAQWEEGSLVEVEPQGLHLPPRIRWRGASSALSSSLRYTKVVDKFLRLQQFSSSLCIFIARHGTVTPLFLSLLSVFSSPLSSFKYPFCLSLTSVYQWSHLYLFGFSFSLL